MSETCRVARVDSRSVAASRMIYWAGPVLFIVAAATAEKSRPGTTGPHVAVSQVGPLESVSFFPYQDTRPGPEAAAADLAAVSRRVTHPAQRAALVQDPAAGRPFHAFGRRALPYLDLRRRGDAFSPTYLAVLHRPLALERIARAGVTDPPRSSRAWCGPGARRAACAPVLHD